MVKCSMSIYLFLMFVDVFNFEAALFNNQHAKLSHHTGTCTTCII